MSNKVKFTPEQKMFFVLKFRELKISLAEFCRLYNVERTAIHRWSIKYDNEGLEGLKEIKKPTKYPSHVLINSVKDYLTGNFSMLQIVKIYNLSGDAVLRTWLKWYNTPKWNIKVGEFMAREKISKDKKIQLVLQYINKEKSAKEIATNNDITEGQLRDWARKYKIHGDNALDDKRGIRKDQSDLSQEEILKKKKKELEEKNRRLEAELLLIKKLKELEGGVI